MTLHFPSIKAVAAELRAAKGYLDADCPETEVRLQVCELGWDLHTGDPSFDQDHGGYWGAGVLTRSSNCRALAAELIEEARTDFAFWAWFNPG
jgi:hypothetical protein